MSCFLIKRTNKEREDKGAIKTIVNKSELSESSRFVSVWLNEEDDDVFWYV